jgi:hypothetical protein
LTNFAVAEGAICCASAKAASASSLSRSAACTAAMPAWAALARFVTVAR